MIIQELDGRLAALPAEKRALAQAMLARLDDQPSTHELSVTQQGLWFIDQLNPGRPLYTLAWRIEIDGALDPAALETAVNAVVARHSALRTRFDVVDGNPVQVVLPRLHVPVPVTDLRHLDSAAVSAACAAEAAAGFDLGTAPLLRVRLLRAAADRDVLVLVVHHIVFDALSIEILLRALDEQYAGALRGEAVQLAPVADYSRFTAWQREHLTGAPLQRLLGYWSKQLEGAEDLLALPTDRPRAAEQSFAGAEYQVMVPAELVDRLRALGAAQRCTLFMVLLAGYQLLLSRYSGQTDICVGSTVDGRSRSEFASTIGFFVNSVVLRGELSGDPTFRELLARTRRTCLQAYDHQDLPFDQLVSHLHPQRSLSHNPLFQTTFEMHHGGSRPARTGDLAVASVEFIDVGLSKFDLSVTAVEVGAEIEFTVEYARELFDKATVARLMDHFQLLLEGIVDDPDAAVSRVPMLPAAERELVVRTWNDTIGEVDDVTLVDLLDAQRARTPDAVAVSYGGVRLSYAELHRRAGQVAALLTARGARPESLVGVLLDRSVELVVVLVGILKAGAAFVPLDPGYPPDRLDYVVGNAGLRLVFTDQALADRVPEGVEAIRMDADAALLASAGWVGPGLPAGPANAAYVVYTSGSTGQPKGAINTHRNIVNQLAWVQGLYRIGADDAILQKTPLGFDDSLREFFWALTSGARLVVAAPDGHRDPAYLARVVQAERVTVLHVVPSLLQALLDDADATARCGSLHLVICSGDVLLPSLQERFFTAFGAQLVNKYGPSEAAIDVTRWVCDPGSPPGPVPIGGPALNTTLYVLDARGEPVPIGAQGELYLGGRQIGRGYLGRQALTAERFVPDPFGGQPGARLYRTGDLCRWRASGQLDYLGRTDHQVKIRGIRIELEEIDAALAAHPQVREAVVLARADNAAGTRLVAYVAPQDPDSFDSITVRADLGTRLPGYMVPAEYVVLHALPLNSNGKIDRKALPAPGASSLAAQIHYQAPRTDLEAVLTEIWADVLNRDRVGAHDDFFDLGGHSLLAVRAVTLIRESFGIAVPVSAIFRGATPARFADEFAAMSDRAGLNTLASSIRAVLALSDDDVEARLEELPGKGRGDR